MGEFDSYDDIIGLFDDEARPMTKSERTRLRIMASAAKVFNEKGFDNTSIQDIADNAGIAKGTVYYYVDKKEDLLLSLIRFGKARLFSKIEKGMDKAGTASDKIELIIRNHLKIMKTVGPVVPFLAQNLISENYHIKGFMAGFRKEYLGLLESIVAEGVASGEFRQVNPKRAAVGILSMIIGQFLQHKIFTGRINAKEIVDTTMDTVIYGLRARNED